MKKLTIGILLLTTLILIGCTAETYDFRNPEDEIESVEIVTAESSLDYKAIKTISETEIEEFMDRFVEIGFNTYYVGDPMSVYGTAVRIVYSDGSYEMVCPHWSEYVENGVVYPVRRSCDENEFAELIDRFS